MEVSRETEGEREEEGGKGQERGDLGIETQK